MKKVADESQKHPEDVTLADRRGWIQDYDIPSGQTHEAVIVRSPTLVPGLTYHVNEAPTPGEKCSPCFISRKVRTSKMERKNMESKPIR